MLDVQVLGSVTAATEGSTHALGGAKQQALLARLVVARGRPVPAQGLVDDLWGEAPPRDALHALQARVSRLRASIPIDIDLVDGGYRVDAWSVRTDAARFEELCEHAAWLIAQGDLHQAAQCLSTARELWRGPAFSGATDVVALRAEAVRLEKVRAAVVADGIDVDLALGRCDAVLPELHALVEENRLSERHWGQLMTALYCAGRSQEALAAFASARDVFAEILGVEPSSDLGALHMGILRELPAESLLRLPVRDPVVEMRAGARSSRDASGRALTSHDSDALVESLREHRTVILTGPAGIGKTHLLRAISSRAEAKHYSAPVLTASPLSELVPLGVFAGSGSSLPQGWTSAASLIDHFTRHRSSTVLIVDNVDQLDDTSLFVVTQLIRTARIPAILSSRAIAESPSEIRALYDSGDLTEIVVEPLAPSDTGALAAQVLGGPLSPVARRRIHEAAEGRPLYLREILTASRAEGRLTWDGTVWELHGDPASTPRLTQLVGERVSGLDQASLEAAALVAIAGELPAPAVGDDERRALARAGLIEYSAVGRVRLTHVLHRETLRSRCSSALWHELSRDAVRFLLSDATADWPAARRRGHILALDLGGPIDGPATLEVAAHAIGTFDEYLALRAARAVAAGDPDNAEAHRIAGLAASSLGLVDAAEAHFRDADSCSTTASERGAVALARARHLGMRHDAKGALAVLQNALEDSDDTAVAGHLRRDAVRWAAVAGQGGEPAAAPAATSDAHAVQGLITAGMSGVITGPLAETEAALVRLREVSRDVIELVPGGADLIELMEAMALSNSGDMRAAQRHLEAKVAEADSVASASLGTWEYALGFGELMSGDAKRAHSDALSAWSHLAWRDTAGLLPAAMALAGASARATGRVDEADEHLRAIPGIAAADPKVVMLRAWSDARQCLSDEREGAASEVLTDTARWLGVAQHHYFAGMLAHCAVRLGVDAIRAASIIQDAQALAGGGLLGLLARHGAATVAQDQSTLGTIAVEAEEMGLFSTATDTWQAITHLSGRGDAPTSDSRHSARAVDRLRSERSGMVLWTHSA